MNAKNPNGSRSKKVQGMSSRGDYQIQWDALRCFTALAPTQSIRKAARWLGSSAPTVSRSLQTLERRLCCQLFDRSERGLTLTLDGERLLERCALITSIVTELQASFEIQPAQEIRISAIPSIGQEIIIPKLGELRRMFPSVRFRMDTSSAVCNLDQSRIDIAIRASRPKDGPYIVRRIGTFTVSCYAKKDGDQPVEPAEQQPLVLLDAEQYEEGRHNSHLLGLYPDNPIAIIVQDFEALLTALRSGLGQALIPDFVGARHPDLTIVPKQMPVNPIDIWLIVRQSSHRLEVTRKLTQTLIHAISTTLHESGRPQIGQHKESDHIQSASLWIPTKAITL